MLHNTLHIQSNNYNASTNTPALATATGYNDNIFQVTTQGIQTINGVSSFCGVGDEIVVSVGVSKFFTVMPVQYNASTSVVGTLAVTITQLQQIGRIITISVAGTQTINGVATNMAVGQAWEYNGVSWLKIDILTANNAFTGSNAFAISPTVPTAAIGTNTTQAASTAFVIANANPTSSYATQAEVNAGTITNKAIAPSTFAASTQLAAKANANNIHFAGDTKLSFQAANHASGNGMWMIANGQSIPTQYTQAIAIFGANLPNITDAVIGVAGGSHLSGTSYGANAVAVPVSSHYHGMTIYNGHTHSMNAYNAHTHGDDHKHNDNGHNHQYFTKTGTMPQSGNSTQCWVGDAYTQTGTGYANINYKSQVSGQSASTAPVNNAGTNVTDAVNFANSRTDDSGTSGVTMSVIQPTYYTKNLFIFCC